MYRSEAQVRVGEAIAPEAMRKEHKKTKRNALSIARANPYLSAK